MAAIHDPYLESASSTTVFLLEPSRAIVLHGLSHALLVQLKHVEAQTELDQPGEGAAEAHEGLVVVALLVVTLDTLPALVPTAEQLRDATRTAVRSSLPLACVQPTYDQVAVHRKVHQAGAYLGHPMHPVAAGVDHGAVVQRDLLPEPLVLRNGSVLQSSCTTIFRLLHA
ncbi:hypothetical protein E2562_030638 [Oryza meyeriana var. granulata]|uniref:Uncharacterized protein n=1 Tax=Oryza meyeriana var. granulata TaxID=110450 RepID=A0A6G1C0A5_9ORYZ|nr:hypothetical protein E2562_030638 [Oryza meyeriana var. granulata]